MKKRKDGRYQLSVTLKDLITEETKRVFAYGKTKPEAEREKARILREWEAQWDGTTATTFKGFCDRLLAERVRGHTLAPNSAEAYTRLFRLHVLPHLPQDAAVGDVTVTRIKFILAQAKSDARRRAIYNALHMVLKEAVFEGLLDASPCDRIRTPRYTDTPAAVITPEQYKLAMATARGQLRNVLQLAFETGMRGGELCGLTWDKIADGKILINASLNAKGVLGKPKTVTSVRTIIISPAAVAMLSAWKRQLRERLMSLGLPLAPDSYVFRSPRSPEKPLSPHSLSVAVGRLFRRLGLPRRACLHSLRHTHATMIASLDLSPKKIQARLGHASAAFTLNRYIHNDNMDAGVLEAVEKIEAVYGITVDKAVD